MSLNILSILAEGFVEGKFLDNSGCPCGICINETPDHISVIIYNEYGSTILKYPNRYAEYPISIVRRRMFEPPEYVKCIGTDGDREEVKGILKELYFTVSEGLNNL